ncbi:MAG: KOW domain-containing RNA-binding protein [Clostridiales bacterium]|nr:KOW domain-containing RNA-binding protein [Clostridiales bacterium]MCD7886091.1 KOW domain-containing RNA-binding protein [Clostridiales bacterium]MCD7929535.1 KOW domain-containing RNA-binding protein [Clostridiales bacterium]MCD8190219.1 KOW domain-containing RNA-binding protein [Clostridiales bacterium]MCD8333999.1 KOW domain-containing RNA-binding protein [Clostridiales bacterium]
MQEIHPYEIVLSLAGHDEGKLFVAVGSDGDYLLLADGKGRKLDAPKRKKRKHLRGVGTSAHPAIQRLQRGEPVTDKQIRCALAAFRESEHPNF